MNAWNDVKKFIRESVKKSVIYSVKKSIDVYIMEAVDVKVCWPVDGSEIKVIRESIKERYKEVNKKSVIASLRD
jgi:hypothetical protein